MIYKFKKIICFISAIGLSSFANIACADTSFSLGLRAWDTQWLSTDGSYSYGTGEKRLVIGSVSAKFDNLIVFGSYSPEAVYDFTEAGWGKPKRKESDINVGYSVHPYISISLGIKSISQKWDVTPVDTIVDFRATTIGLSAAAPIPETSLFMFGSAAFGPVKATSNNASWAIESNGLYGSTDFGMGYSLSSAFKLTMSYRYQHVPYVFQGVKVQDNTSGIALGGIVTF